MNLPLFDDPNPAQANLRADIRALARQGVFLGTSSWKYPGWCGQIYDPARYEWRGKFAESRFNRECLREYSETFPTVSVDAAYYKFPDAPYLQDLAAQVHDDFLFAFKITDEITVKRFPNLPRFGARAGKANANFLNADLFLSAFLTPCETIRPKIGLLMFEFSKFHPADFPHRTEFVNQLDRFLSQLPANWPFAVEIRNKDFLHPEYFSTLRKHGVAHVYNSWQAMPPVHEQLALPDSWTQPSLLPARFLLSPGRNYNEAVQRFQPYSEIKAPDPDARSAAAQLINKIRATGGRARAFLYVNNRLEGNAPATLRAIMDAANQVH